MHVSDSALYISHCTVTVCTWSYRHGHRGMVVYRISYINLPTITIEICNCHLQKIRQLSRNGICCMIALFLISISACDFHLKLLIHMHFAMKLSVHGRRPWAPPYWIIFRSHAKATESASTSLRRESQKLCALGKHFRWTFSGGVAVGHCWASWPLHDLWPQQCITLWSEVLPTKFSDQRALSKLTPTWPQLTPTWPLTQTMHYALVRGSSHQIWWP